MKEREEKLGVLFKKIHNAFEAKANKGGREMDITAAQLDILVYLCENQGRPVAQKDIEAFLSISNPTVTGILNRMEEKQLINRKPMESDRRCRLITMTDRSRELLEIMRRKMEEREQRLVANMTEDEVRQLCRLLKIVLENLSQEEACPSKKRVCSSEKDACPSK